MTRTPIDAPLACFGLEHQPKDPKCQSCPHEAECMGFMGTRKGRIPITKATFSLLPGTEEESRAAEYDFAGEYTFAIEQVFQKKLMRLPSCVKDSEFRQLVEANTGTLNCSLRLYLLTAMYAYKNEQPNREFNPRFLVGRLALPNVTQYREATRSIFASFCEDSVEMLLSGKDDQHAEELFFNSEIQFAGYLLGWRIKRSSNGLDELYRVLELRLDPAWLATEPTYKLPATDHSASPTLREHRYTVVRARTAMKRNRGLRMGVFRLRERLMPLTAVRVLGHYGFDASDFLTFDVPIRDAVRFWNRLGLALQHLYCLRFLDGDPRSARSLGSTSA